MLEEQKQILFELEMILQTTKQIDNNLAKCIDVVDDNVTPNFNDTIHSNVVNLKEILELLGQLKA